MRWLKATEAAKEWAGGVAPKTLYTAVKAGHLQAARIGAGRNLLFCEQWVDDWLTGSVRERPTTATVHRSGFAGRRA